MVLMLKKGKMDTVNGELLPDNNLLKKFLMPFLLCRDAIAIVEILNLKNLQNGSLKIGKM